MLTKQDFYLCRERIKADLVNAQFFNLYCEMSAPFCALNQRSYFMFCHKIGLVTVGLAKFYYRQFVKLKMITTSCSTR